MRVLYIVLGLLFLALGTVGIVLPLLPTVPFYLLAAFFLGKGSRKLDAWFKGTGFYQAHVQPLQEGKGMTVRAKAKAFGTVTLLLGLGFIFMSAILWGRAILVAVWIFHIWLFWAKIPTAADEADAEEAEAE